MCSNGLPDIRLRLAFTAMAVFPLQNVSIWSEDYLLETYPRLLRRFCRRPLFHAASAVLILVLVFAIAGSLFGDFRTGEPANFPPDPGFIASVAFAFTCFYYYLKMPTHFSSSMRTLRTNGIFTSDDIEISDRTIELARDRRIIAIPSISAALAGLAVIATGIVGISGPPEVTHWSHRTIITGTLVVFNWTLIWLALSGLIVSMAVAAAALNSIFDNNRIVVHRLHPDRGGGFSPVGDFSLKLTPMAILPGLIIGFSVWESINQGTFRYDSPQFIVSAAICLGIIPALFYLPIRSARKAMLRYRDGLIRETYERYSAEHQSKHEAQNEGALKNIKDSVEQMDVLERLAKHESSYPVWPFGYRSRVGVFLNSTFPLTCTLAGVVVDNMIGI